MISDEIIKILEYLGDKFGIIVDWTSENIIPYAQDLFNRIIKYNIIFNSIGATICLFIISGYIIYVTKLYKLWKIAEDKYYDIDNPEYTHTWYYDSGLTDGAFVLTVFGGLVTIASLIIMIISIIEIISWLVIPEVQIWEMVREIS